MQYQVSMYGSAMDTKGKTCSLQDILSEIKKGKWKNITDHLRSIKDEDVQKEYKKKNIPCFTPSGTFQDRKVLIKHTGVIVMDFDTKDNPGLLSECSEHRQALIEDEYTYFLFSSCRGDGLAVGVKIDPDKHLNSFLHLEKYYKDKHELKADICKDVNRLRFVSYDPHLYINENSKAVQIAEEIKELSNHDIVKKIIASGKLIGNDTYDEWFRIGRGLATEFGEAGRQYFHALSSRSPKYSYEENEKKYNDCMKENSGKITFGTIVAYAKQAGVDIQYSKFKSNDIFSNKLDSILNIEELKKYIDKSPPDEDIGIVRVSQVYDEIDKLYEHGFQRGILTGWANLDEYYTIRPGEVTIMTGIPSHGKSTFLTNLLVNIARKESWKFGVFSPENQPISRHVAHMAQIYTGMPFSSEGNEKMTRGALEYAKEWCDRHFIFLQPKDDELQIENIMKMAAICCLKDGTKGLVIDPWNEIDHSRPYSLSETEYISKCLTKIRYFARTYKVHIWLIAHPTKMMKRQDGTYSIPTPYDVSGSAHFRNKADCCLCVWRDLDLESTRKYETDIYVQKIRFHEVGKIGKATLTYNPLLQNYH